MTIHLFVLVLAVACMTTSCSHFETEINLFDQLDTWEPQIITTGDTVIVTATNVGGIRACLNCGADPIIYKRSTNNGKTFDANNYIYSGELTWFADSVVAKDRQGNLYITYIGFEKYNPWNILFQKSTDNGKTWSDPVISSCGASSDKNWIGVDQKDPNNIYVTFNVQFPYASSSADNGATWNGPVRMDIQEGSYFYAGGVAVRSTGEVFYAYVATPMGDDAEDEHQSYGYGYYGYYQDDTYTVFNQTNSNYTYARVYSSEDKGLHFKNYNISAWEDNQKCPGWAQCNDDFFTGSCQLTIDKNDVVYYIYNGDDNSTATVETRVMLTTLDADASEFSEPIDVSDAPLDANVYHVSVMIASNANAAGDIRIAWMDNRTSAWNVYYRESKDGGKTFSHSVKLSTLNEYSYQSEYGFQFPYGDYASLTVDDNGLSKIVWGEGLGWYAGGSVYYASQKESTASSSLPGYAIALIVIAVLAVVGFPLIYYGMKYVRYQHRVTLVGNSKSSSAV